MEEALRPRLDWAEPVAPRMPEGEPFVVRDDALASSAGSMNRSAFLAELRTELTKGVETGLAGTDLSTEDCPYLLVLFSFLEQRDSRQLDALVRVSADEVGGGTARAFIGRMGEIATQSTKHWVTTGELGGLPAGLPSRIGVLLARMGSAPEVAALATIAGLGRGRPLEGGTASRMRTAFGSSLPDVAIHTGPAAGAIASRHGASALTVGKHVAFAAGAYKPGTPTGDALLAHEMAHAVQQVPGSRSSSAAASGSLEQDADVAAAGVVTSLWGRLAGGARNVARVALPRMRTGLRLQRCPKRDAIQHDLGDNPWNIRVISRDHPGVYRFPTGTTHRLLLVDWTVYQQRNATVAGRSSGVVGVVQWKIYSPSGDETWIRSPSSADPPEVTFDEVGEWEAVALIHRNGDEKHVVRDVFEVFSAEDYGKDLLQQSFGADFDFEHFRIGLALEQLRLGGGVTKDQPSRAPGQPYITVNGDNPVRSESSKTVGFKMHATPEAHSFQWYFLADDLEALGGEPGNPSKAVLPVSGVGGNGRKWRELDNIGAWGFARAVDKSTSPSTNLLVSQPNTYWVMCAELDEHGQPLGTPTAVYKQVVLGKTQWDELEKLKKHIEKVDSSIKSVVEDTEVPIRAVLVARDGSVTPLALFAGRSKKDAGKVRLLDLTPNAPKSSYEVSSAAGAPASDALLQKFVKDNEYPEGYVTFEVPDAAANLGLTPCTVTHWISHPKSWTSKFSTTAGWISMGATVLGFLSLLSPVTAGASPYLFGVGAGAGAVSAGASLVARFQEGRATTTGVAIDLLALAANLLQLKTLRVQAKVPTLASHGRSVVEKQVRYLMYTQLAIEGAEVVFIAADTIIQIDAILDDEDKSRSQKIDEIVRLLGQVALTGGLFVRSASAAKAAAKPARGSEPNRLGALDQSADDFLKDEKAQRDLYDAATKMRDQQDAMGKAVLADLDVPGEAKSILKRDDFSEFRDGIVEKVRRQEYDSLTEMDDIVRGRFNLENPEDVETVVKRLEDDPMHHATNVPKSREGVAGGYPRYHVIMRDPDTGLTHEWQVGTAATTKLFEKPGIDLGKLVLKKGMKPNIHDIEYDIFKRVQEDDLDFATKLGIPKFRKDLATIAEATGRRRFDEVELNKRISEFHESASKILRELIEAKGVDYVKKFFH